MGSVSICILTFNRCALLRELLVELERLHYAQLEILVVDNHSEDATHDMMVSEFTEVRYVRTNANIGAAARNLGMKAARHDIIITLDDDVRGLKDKDIEVLAAKFSEEPKLGAVNFRVTNPEGKTCNWVHHCREDEWCYKEFLTYEITEGAVAFRRKALDESGYYAETFFLGHEGPDLAFRIFESDFRVIYSGDIEVRHYFATQGRDHWRNYYYDTRNQLWIAARNYPVSYALAYLGRGLSSMLLYCIRDGYVYYWLKAIVDGVAGLRRAMKERHALSSSTMKIIREIDSRRPGILYMLRKRLFAKNAVNLN